MTKVCGASPGLLVFAVALLGACPPADGDSPSSSSDTQSTSDTPTTSSTSSTSSADTSDAASETVGIQPFCGDGVLGADEDCDDGNISDADSCLANCTPAACGDAHLWIGTEECDEGDNNDAKSFTGCRPQCTLAACGDGALYPITLGPRITLAAGVGNDSAKISKTSPRAVAIDKSGQVYAITDWSLSGGTKHQVVLERFSADGILVKTTVIAEGIFPIEHPSIAVTAGGALITLWQQNTQNESNVYYRRYDPMGAPIEAATDILENSLGNQHSPMVASNNAGDFVVTFRAIGGPDLLDHHIIRARKIPARGPAKADFIVSSLSVDISAPTASIRDDGSFIVGYSDRDLGLIYIHEYSSEGILKSILDPVTNLHAAATTESRPWIGAAALEDGGIAVAGITDADTIGVRRYGADGSVIFEEAASNTPYSSIPRIELIADAAANLVVLWGACGLDREGSKCSNSDAELAFRRIYADGELFGNTTILDTSITWKPQGVGIATNALGDLAIVAEDTDPFLWIARANCP